MGNSKLLVLLGGPARRNSGGINASKARALTETQSDKYTLEDIGVLRNKGSAKQMFEAW